MSTGSLAILVLAVCLAIGGGIAALADTDDGMTIEAIDLDDGATRKDDVADEVMEVEDDDDRGDGDRTRGNDGTDGGNNTGDGDATAGNDGTGGGDNTGDGDGTDGDDGTNGRDNTGDGDGTDGDDGTNGRDNTGDVTYDAPAGTDTGGGDTT